MGQRARRDEQATVRMDAGLKQAIAIGAKATGMSQNAFMVEAFRRYVQGLEAEQTDGFIAPMVAETITGAIRTYSASNRKMTVRLAYETLRLQYVMCEFLVQAGIPVEQVETWRKDGWTWAVRVLKQASALEGSENE